MISNGSDGLTDDITYIGEDWNATMFTGLNGKRIMVTGAAGGVGLSTVARLSELGAIVLATDIDPGGREALEAHARGAEFLEHDIRDAAGWQRAIELMMSNWGGIDVLVNNAAYLRDDPLLTLDVEFFRQHVEINLIGTWLGMRTAAQSMMASGKGGAIINIASVSGMIGHPGRGAYASTKWALRGLTRTAALEWAPHDIRVCGIVPGPVDTPMSRRARGLDPAQSLRDLPLPDVPLRRFGSPGEVADAVAYLSSESASYITGSELVIDGGCLLSR